MSIALVLIVFVSTLFTAFFPATPAKADEYTVTYSNVLDDLKADSNFDETAYPAYTYKDAQSNGIKLLDVISIGENQSGELFLYVYNPTKADLNITASQISMYCAFASSPKEFSPQLYDLSLLSSEGVFDKYLVKNFTIQAEPQRYYNIVEISRPFNLTIDTSIENGTTDDKAIPVGKQWCCYFYNDELIYEMATFNVLEITPTLNGNVFYKNGITWGSLVGISSSCNAHFFAFNCENYIVEHIYDADLTYNYRDVSSFYNGLKGEDEPEYGKFSSRTITLYDSDKVTYEGSGLFSKEYSWNRIMTAEKFIENFEGQGGVLNETSKDILQKSQWVFAFVETEYKKNPANDSWGSYWEYYTDVADVDILRVHFMDNTGKYYNLGVVGDKTTADNIPDGEANDLDFDSMFDWLKLILGLIGLLIILVLLWPFISPIISGVFKLIWKGVWLIIKGVFGIITLPLRLLFGLFKR